MDGAGSNVGVHSRAVRGGHRQATACLPAPRGQLTALLLPRLRHGPHPLPGDLDDAALRAGRDDLHLALYCLYELHYRGFADVDEGWEWEPTVLRLRGRLEGRFEKELREAVAEGAGARAHPVAGGPDGVVGELWGLARDGSGPSLSEWVRDHASIAHVRELFKHRTAYQLKEADPHTWVIPRLDGKAKAVLTAIQADEYGNGSPADMHSALFARTLEALGLDRTPNAYLDEIPGWTLATTNLISLFGLHRRLRGCLVGHLALFEMTSTGPMSRYAAALRRLGLPAEARRFFEVHVEADEQHQHMAADGMVAGLVESEPDLAGDVLFGARALSLVEQRFTAGVLRAWTSGRSSLRPPGSAAGGNAPTLALRLGGPVPEEGASSEEGAA